MKKILITVLAFLHLGLVAQGTLLSESSEGEIQIENCARINDRESQFGPVLYGDKLVFLARNNRGNVDPRTGKAYFGLFAAERNPDGMPLRARRFSEELSSNYNEGPVTFSNEDRVIYFTRTQLDAGTTLEDRAGRANLGIYSAYRAQYDWAAIRSLPFNGLNYSSQHPSISANSKRIFFSSNREGGYGGLDLYFSDHRDGKWGPAINLGPDINTEGNEAFPFIHPSGRLFFASTGHGGRGGYDIYMIDISQRRWGKLYNLPPPINSPRDDISLVLTADATLGYLASNRPGGEGEDDIYRLRLDNGLESLQGPSTDGETLVVYDGANSRRVANAEVWLSELDEQGRRPASHYSFRLGPPPPPGSAPTIEPTPKPLGELSEIPLRTANDGSIRLELTEGKSYEVNVFQAGFTPQNLRFTYTATGPSRPLTVILSPAGCARLSGRILAGGNRGLEGVTVSFSGGCGGPPLSVVTDLGGYYEACLPFGCDFTISTNKRGYVGATATATADQLGQFPHPRLELVVHAEGQIDRRDGGAAGAILPLPGIAFYPSGSALVENRRNDLRLVAELLHLRPDLSVSLLGHVSGNEPEITLQSLSEARAQSVRQSLLGLGVSGDQLTTAGFGGRYPLRPCNSCSTEDHAVNSRIEAKIEMR